MATGAIERLTLEVLKEAVQGRAAAFRRRCRLQPAGGPGDKVFPPTYEGGQYAFEDRRVLVQRPDGTEGFETVPCVLLDSVQSQANRMEEALQEALDAGRIQIPLIEVDFSPFDPGSGKGEELELLSPIGKVTTLQAPHRIADAILRDSVYKGQGFRKSELGRSLDLTNLYNATSVYEICPTALVFGMWDSTGPKGGLGVKFERAIVSEIIGICCKSGKKTSSRIDPLGIQKNAGPLYKRKDQEMIEWTLDREAAEEGKEGKPVLFNRGGTKGESGSPSKANLGNVAPTIEENGGVTIDYAELITVLSLVCLRRLKFPPVGRTWEPSQEQCRRDHAARTVLAALGLCAAELAAERGLDLRSRCVLWPVEPLRWELLEEPGRSPRQFELGADAAVTLLTQAVQEAAAAGVTWRTERIRLVPTDDLVKLVRRSQQLAAQEIAE